MALRLHTVFPQRMRQVVRPAMERCFKTSTPALGNIIGLPIRGSDKCYRMVNGVRHGEADCVTPAQTIAMATRLHVAQPWIDKLLVTSEDKSVLESVPRLPEMSLGGQKRWTLLTNDGDVQQGTGRTYSAALKSADTEKEALTPAKIMESILTTLSCQVLPSHHIVLMKSSASRSFPIP